MAKSLVVGQTNAGKTCFTINFADYLGINELKFTLKQPAGFSSQRTYQLQAAREELVSSRSHTTTEIQQVQLQLPVGKGKKELKLMDTCGLVEGIHSDRGIRKAMAQTLTKLRQADIVLHIIDLAKLSSEGIQKISELDLEIYNYCKVEKCYAVLANKTDLKVAQKNLSFLQEKLNQAKIIPISALYQQGFRKVKRFLLKNL
ncbi:GTPase domain-containing protein [Acetohalobium arabaticum]|uniref:GTP-binding protein HSR1-related protein n=1 Tax=Acetohalobium arabaticum (strain ATCC 49924 / DSM 5501 / Z-7288) TaxID=574087 RepID=D9QQ91_ACEAZ|nr:GTPase domain-containing protein [Acetohalobium arabaticum]ADL12682.1 GTP-binding protein HSR1-related protein [Acetohalobium arabaticum DSM 5501]